MATTPTVCEHLHLPLQSGSDRVLSAMHRGYRAERYLEKLAAAREAIDDLAVTTDIIVGFPGETDDDFDQTLEVVAGRVTTPLHVHLLSAQGYRSGGDGRRIRPPEVVRERMARLTEVVEGNAREARRAWAASKRCWSTARRRPIPRCGRAAPATTSCSTSHRRCSPTRARSRLEPVISWRFASRARRRTGCVASSAQGPCPDPSQGSHPGVAVV